MNFTGFWKALVGTGFIVVMSLSAWTMNTIAEIPKEYTSIEEFKELRRENREDHKELMQRIETVLEKLSEHNR